MPVDHPHILYVGTCAYDLRKVSSAVVDQENPTIVWVRFHDEDRTILPLPRAAFESAWQASLDALLPETPPGTLDVSGVYPALKVVGLRGKPIDASAENPPHDHILQYSTTQQAWVLTKLHYVHHQTVPATTWTVTHQLHRYPSTTVLDSAGSVLLAEIHHVSTQVLTVTVTQPLVGTVYCV